MDGERRAICRPRGVMQSDVGDWEYEAIWKPDPDAPSVSEVVESMRNAREHLVVDKRGRTDCIKRLEDLIARLDGGET